MKKIIVLRWLRLIMIFILLVVLTLFIGSLIKVYAQSNRIAIGITKDVSGDGMGSNYSPSLGWTTNKSLLSVSALIQKRTTNFSGLRLEYQFSPNLVEGGGVDLFFYTNVAYNWDSKLSNTSLLLERRVNRGDEYPIADMTFQTLQYYAGFGVKFETKNNLDYNLGIGIGGYHTLNTHYEKLNMYRPKSGAVLQMRIGMNYTFPSKRVKSNNQYVYRKI